MISRTAGREAEAPERIIVPPITYRPHRYQIRLHESGARFLSAAAGVRAGKTIGGAAEFGRRIVEDIRAGRGNLVSGGGRQRRPRLHYWIVSPTYPLLKEPKRAIFETIPRAWIDRYYNDDDTLWLRGDILIEFKGADRPQNLVSVGLNGMWIDEAARVKADAWRGQLRPRLSDKPGWCLFTTTPLGRNWFYDDIVARHGDPEFPNYKTVTWRTIDNDRCPGLVEDAAQAKRELPERYYKREYEASFDAFTGGVFDEWNESIHVVSEDALRAEYHLNGKGLRSCFRKVVAGVDWGWNAPGCIIVIGDLGGRWLAVEESYAPNRIVFDPRLTEGTWVSEARRLREKWGITAFYADPSQPAAIWDFMRAGLPCFAANNELVFGIRKVSEALHPIAGRPRLQVHERCTNLRRELSAYQWAPNKAGDTFTDAPMDGQSDHAIDPTRYCMVELMENEPAGPVRRAGGYAAGPVM